MVMSARGWLTEAQEKQKALLTSDQVHAGTSIVALFMLLFESLDQLTIRTKFSGWRIQ